MDRGYIIGAVEPAEAAYPVTTYKGRKAETKQKILCYEAVGSHKPIVFERFLRTGVGQMLHVKVIDYWEEDDRAYLVVGLRGHAIQRFGLEFRLNQEKSGQSC
ncbi:hypothetical protein [Chroococcidiopsis cubana]|uniref:hypothetical protein n=1 Tax=Chroococcidiopsis cubana TaxID=171392 RepID=UPI000F8DA684|nr:hypothetical protein [Chroococcidiopsis cubana]